MDDLDFFYSSTINKKTKKRGFLFKHLPTKKQISCLPKLLTKKERFLLIIFSLIVLGSLISLPVGFYLNATEVVADFGGSLKEGVIGRPRFINPVLLQTEADRDLAQLIYSGLLKNDGKGNYTNDLAENIQISEDGSTYVITLKKNVKWHDGYEFTADDVVFTIETIQNKNLLSPLKTSWKGVEATRIDKYTVKIDVKDPYAHFLNNLTIGILPKHIWQKTKPISFALSEMNLEPIGTGPYKFWKLKKDKFGRIILYELKANEEYYDGKPFIEKIVFKFYSSEEELIQAFNISEIDSLSMISANNIKDLRFPGKIVLEKLRFPRYFSVFFNQNKSKALSDKNVRLALAHSTNKDKIIELINGEGLKIDSPFLPEIFGFNKDIKKYDYNPEFAKQILENSGWKDEDNDGIREKGEEKLEINLLLPIFKELQNIAQVLKNDWENIGVKINIVAVPIEDIYENYLKNRDYQMILFGEVLNLNPDPFSFWHSSNRKYPGLNLALYFNKSVDKLLEEARKSFDPIVRTVKYNDAQSIIIEDLPAIFLYTPNYIYPRSKKIKGFDEKLIEIPSERFVNISKWYVETKRQWKKNQNEK